MKMNRLTALAAIAGLACAAHAGDLVPPAGPIAPTMKTLTEVEPRIVINAENTPGDADSAYRITQPGSYYFDRSQIVLNFVNLGANAEHLLEIAAPNVTVDLNGFRFEGQLGSLDGIKIDGNHDNIVVQNGTLVGFDTGVNLEDRTLSSMHRVENVRVLGSTVKGIDVAPRSVVTGCTVGDTTGIGIDTSSVCVVEDCVVSDNTTGITPGTQTRVERCVIVGGTNGLSLSTRNIIRENTVSACSNTGLFSSINGAGNRIEDNSFITNNVGVFIDGTGNILRGNTATGSTISNWDVQTGNTCYVIDATAGGTFAVGNSGGTPTTASSWVNYSH